MKENASTTNIFCENTFPSEVWIMIIEKFDIGDDWEAVLACWSVRKLRPIIRLAFESWDLAIVAYQYSGNKCVELGIQFASSYRSVIINLVSNRVNIYTPIVCRVLSNCILENLLLNNLTTLSNKSIALVSKILRKEGYICTKDNPDDVGERIFLVDCSRTPAYVGIRVVSVSSGVVTIEIPPKFVPVFHRLNYQRLYDERCKVYSIRPFKNAVVTLDTTMDFWLTRHEDFLRKSQEQQRFGENTPYNSNYSKRLFPFESDPNNITGKRRKTSRINKRMVKMFIV